eukprot:359468-Chlamydomonas_euryale.AAC.7
MNGATRLKHRPCPGAHWSRATRPQHHTCGQRAPVWTPRVGGDIGFEPRRSAQHHPDAHICHCQRPPAAVQHHAHMPRPRRHVRARAV